MRTQNLLLRCAPRSAFHERPKISPSSSNVIQVRTGESGRDASRDGRKKTMDRFLVDRGAVRRLGISVCPTLRSCSGRRVRRASTGFRSYVCLECVYMCACMLLTFSFGQRNPSRDIRKILCGPSLTRSA